MTNAQNTSPTAQDEAEQAELSDQMQFRLAKRARLLESGREAYPVGVERTHSLAAVRA